MIAAELAGIACFGIAAAMMWFARPVGGAKAAFLTGEVREVLYALVVVALVAGGVGGAILGFTG